MCHMEFTCGHASESNAVISCKRESLIKISSDLPCSYASAWEQLCTLLVLSRNASSPLSSSDTCESICRYLFVALQPVCVLAPLVSFHTWVTDMSQPEYQIQPTHNGNRVNSTIKKADHQTPDRAEVYRHPNIHTSLVCYSTRRSNVGQLLHTSAFCKSHRINTPPTM